MRIVSKAYDFYYYSGIEIYPRCHVLLLKQTCLFLPKHPSL